MVTQINLKGGGQMALGHWCRYYGLELLKEGRKEGTFYSQIKFFRSKVELDNYLEKYIYNRPNNARKIHALNRFICETKEITNIYDGGAKL